MTRSAVLNVDCLDASQRQAIESALGGTLEHDEKIYIVVCRPDLCGPDDETRRRARAGLQSVLSKIDANIAASNVAEGEMDASLDEALRHVRSVQSA